MSTCNLNHTCAVCGAEESLDTLLHRMIDDDTTRRLLAELVTASLPVGAAVVRYLRLHKPAKQRLRLEKVRELLGELVPDIRRGAITRKGREWQAPDALWRAGFSACFDAAEKGALTLPLQGNAYLYEVMLRHADKAEAQIEREQQEAGRSRAHTGGPVDLGNVLPAAVVTTATPAPTYGPSPTALRIQAEIAEKLARRAEANHG